jgi:hypothetical protein
MMATPVILRRWDDGSRDLIALFPTLPADGQGNLCMCYEHVGQHGGACYASVRDHSTPVSADDPDAQALLRELRAIGYDDLRVGQRATVEMRVARRREAREAREEARA